jgi:hypothetical protein
MNTCKFDDKIKPIPIAEQGAATWRKWNQSSKEMNVILLPILPKLG